MTDTNKSLDIEKTGVTIHPVYDAYLNIPFRKKNSSIYRAIAKRLGARYDSIECRWVISNNRLNDSMEEISKNNLFDSWKFVYRKENDDIIYNPYKLLHEIPEISLVKLFNGKLNANAISVDKKNVLFITTKNAQAVNVVFWDSENIDYLDVKGVKGNYNYIDYSVSKTIVIPKEFARDIWVHYSKTTKTPKISKLDPRLVNEYFFKTHGVRTEFPPESA